jgi:hypothetical protein
MVLPNAAGSNDKQAFLQALKDTLSDFYNKEPGTNLEKLYSALATILSLTDREISALRNDNVLSAVILDEVISRGITALDHLSQEGVFNIERVGFTPTTFVRQELHRIEKDTTTIVMNYIPVNFRTIQIFNSQDSDRIMVSQVLNFDEATNSIQVAGVAKPGLYTFQYVDTGNVKSETEDLVVPAEVFLTGFGEGGFGNYGFGE